MLMWLYVLLLLLLVLLSKTYLGPAFMKLCSQYEVVVAVDVVVGDVVGVVVITVIVVAVVLVVAVVVVVVAVDAFVVTRFGLKNRSRNHLNLNDVLDHAS